MSKIPYVAIGNEELADAETVQEGDEVDCPHCSKTHILEAGKDPNGKPQPLLLFYQCGIQTCVAAIAGKLVPKFGCKKHKPAWGGKED